jgi:UDP-GlcNAc:undecaprenyl-phosphate GlcNAc-1-phosphate transferase
MHHYPYMLVGGILLSASLMPLLMRVARRLGIVDHPLHRKIHANPIPYLGGLGIVAGFTLIPAAYLYYYRDILSSAETVRFACIMVPALAAAVLGLADDKKPVHATTKFLTQLAIFIPFAFLGFRIEVVKLPGLGEFSLYDMEGVLLTVAWMLGVVNGVNLIDGIDGLAGSVTAIIFAAIAILALNLSTPDHLVAGVALAALGATLGFLFFNWKPAKIYLGDGGSLASGTLIAALLIALGQNHRIATFGASQASVREPYSYQFAKITLLAFYPLMEISLSIVRRLLRGKPISSADKGHVHHRLLRWGWSAPAICFGAVLFSAIAATTVIAAQLQYKGVSGWMLVAGGVLFGLLLHFCGILEIFQPKAYKGHRPHFLIANHFMAMQRVKLELAQSISEISTLAGQTCIEFGVDTYSLRLAAGGARPEPLKLEWSKPASAHGSLLLPAEAPQGAGGVCAVFSDKQSLPSGSSAAWTFEPHEVEDEIDVEYRVLVSDFMRKAIGCAEYLYQTCLDENAGTSSDAGVSSTKLRRRASVTVRVSPN